MRFCIVCKETIEPERIEAIPATRNEDALAKLLDEYEKQQLTKQ